MSERVPDSPVSRLPNAERFIAVRSPLVSVSFPSVCWHHGVKLPSGFDPPHAPSPNPLEFGGKASTRRDLTADMPA